MDSILVREFRKDDLNELLAILSVSFTEELTLKGFDKDRIRQMVGQMFGITGRVFYGLSRLLGKDPGKFLVAEFDSKLVGSAMISKRRSVGYISNVMVHPNYRRRGIARKLIDAALSYAREKAMDRVVLHVASKNFPAKNLYANIGFKPFEKIAWLVRKTHPIHYRRKAKDVKIRSFRKADTNAVYELVRSSEDPERLEVLEFEKADLATPLIQRIFQFYKERKLIAIQDDQIVGFLRVSHTSPKEAARIRDVHVSPDRRSKGLEEMLLHSGTQVAENSGIKKILATASAKRPHLIAAMKKIGFEEYEEMEGMVLNRMDVYP